MTHTLVIMDSIHQTWLETKSNLTPQVGEEVCFNVTWEADDGSGKVRGESLCLPVTRAYYGFGVEGDSYVVEVSGAEIQNYMNEREEWYAKHGL